MSNKILISACVYGDDVRWNGSNRHHQHIHDWAEENPWTAAGVGVLAGAAIAAGGVVAAGALGTGAAAAEVGAGTAALIDIAGGEVAGGITTAIGEGITIEGLMGGLGASAAAA